MQTTALFRRAGATVAGAAIAFAAAAAVAGSAQAKADPTGDFAVTVNGTTYNPAAGKDVKLKDLAVSGKIQVRGVNVNFDFDAATLGVYDYTLTGAPSPDRMVTSPTVIFASKVPVLTAAQRTGVRLTQLEVKDDNATIILQTSAGKMKVQAKDAPAGGIFQMEPEFGARMSNWSHTCSARHCSTSSTRSPTRSTSATARTR